MNSKLAFLVLCLAIPAVALSATFLPENGTPGTKQMQQYLKDLPPEQRTISIDDMVFDVDAVRRSGFTGTRWTDGIVYWYCSSLSPDEKKQWIAAIKLWADCARLHFVEMQVPTGNYIYVRTADEGQASSSAVGMQSGEQVLQIAQSDWGNIYNIAHEIGHALGMTHEHQRSDRDNYVSICDSNIMPGKLGQFSPAESTVNYGDYDFDSIMHYNRCEWSIWGTDCPLGGETIIATADFFRFQYSMGQRDHLSASDRDGMAARYGAPRARDLHFEEGAAPFKLLPAGHGGADTVFILGGPGTNMGKFQDSTGTLPDAQGWSGVSRVPGVGDFSKIWPRLADIDPCANNNTPQFAFIDDGLVVSGTGGTLGASWTYGPGGYVVNLTGGLGGSGFYLDNEIWSPVLSWPAGNYDGAELAFDVYRHLPLRNGIFCDWHVRSSADGGCTWSPWRDRDMVYYGESPAYLRIHEGIEDLLEPGRTHIQVALGVAQCGWLWGFNSSDATPAPYYDNVRLTAFSCHAPDIRARDIDLFNSGFPAIGVIDYTTAGLANNSIRVDMARNISDPADLRNDPGDSMVMTVTPVRAGADLIGPPEMHIVMKANPLFDGVRVLPGGFTQVGQLIEGVVLADSARTQPSATPIPNLWSWDLPDTGFFFPGDVIHYYIEAHDNVSGDVGAATLPGDTTGFSYFPGTPGNISLRFASNMKVRGLPSMPDTIQAHQPHILWWNDNENRGMEDEWYGALDQLAYREGIDYDVYYNNGCSSGVGNGLGGRATETQLAGYRTLLYNCGGLSDYLVSNGDYNEEPSRDIQVLEAWFALGSKNAFFTGEDLCSNMRSYCSGSLTAAFLAGRMGITCSGKDVRTYIGNQTTPWVKPVTGNIPGLTVDYIAYGGCQVINDFDRILPVTGASTMMQWTSPAGATGYSTYAAGIYYNGADNSRCITLPYDFGLVFDKAPHTGGQPSRNALLSQILTFFGNLPSGSTTVEVPDAGKFLVKVYPNPLNPQTTIAFNLPVAGDLSVRLYDVRGRLVRVLHEGAAAAGAGRLVWDGRDERGRDAGSGVYFCEVRAAAQTTVHKLVLVR